MNDKNLIGGLDWIGICVRHRGGLCEGNCGRGNWLACVIDPAEEIGYCWKSCGECRGTGSVAS